MSPAASGRDRGSARGTRVGARGRALAAVLAATLSLAGTAQAQQPPWMEADQHFRRGVQLFKESDYAAALVEFQRAYEIDPRFQVLYNVAQAHLSLQDYAAALRTYERYLEDGGAKIPPRRRKDVEAEIATLQKRVAKVSVRTNEPGATIAIDDVEIGAAPLDGVLVSAGRRKITAMLSGRSPATKVVEVVGGDDLTVELEIPPLPTPVVITKEVPRAPPLEPPSAVPTIVGWSVTGALTVGAVVTGVVALGASSDLEAELARFPGDPEALASAKDTTFALGLATDVLIGTSVVAAGVATYLTIDYVLASDEAQPPAGEPAARLRVGPRGVSVDGSF